MLYVYGVWATLTRSNYLKNKTQQTFGCKSHHKDRGERKEKNTCHKLDTFLLFLRKRRGWKIKFQRESLYHCSVVFALPIIAMKSTLILSMTSGKFPHIKRKWGLPFRRGIWLCNALAVPRAGARRSIFSLLRFCSDKYWFWKVVILSHGDNMTKEIWS